MDNKIGFDAVSELYLRSKKREVIRQAIISNVTLALVTLVAVLFLIFKVINTEAAAALLGALSGYVFGKSGSPQRRREAEAPGEDTNALRRSVLEAQSKILELQQENIELRQSLRFSEPSAHQS